jgi:hypothetical protein
MISMNQGVPHEGKAEMASWGRVVAHFPARMQPKQCYDSLTLNTPRFGSARANLLT